MRVSPFSEKPVSPYLFTLSIAYRSPIRQFTHVVERRENVTEDWRKLHNEELHDFAPSPVIINMSTVFQRLLVIFRNMIYFFTVRSY